MVGLLKEPDRSEGRVAGQGVGYSPASAAVVREHASGGVGEVSLQGHHQEALSGGKHAML
jgi:hypothetical protein